MSRAISPRGDSAREVHDRPLEDDLRLVLDDLDDVIEEAKDEGFPVPSLEAINDASVLLRDLYRLRPCRLEAYPAPDGEIALRIPGGPGRSVLLLCAANGSVLCSVNLNGRHRRARYSTSAGLPDEFVRDALKDLDEPANGE